MACQQDCSMLLQKVYETGFALDDAVLYLDTHPGCTNGWNYYLQAKQLNDAAIDAYEQVCGPLMNTSVSQPWNWLDNPWPWEGGTK